MANYTRTGKKVQEKMYDVKQKDYVMTEAELVVLKNGRNALTGVNPTTGMTMFKLISKKRAQEISGEIIV